MQLMSAMPTDQAETAKLMVQNKDLTEALRRIRDSYEGVKSKYDKLKEDSDNELSILRSKSIKCDKMEEDLSEAKESIEGTFLPLLASSFPNKTNLGIYH